MIDTEADHKGQATGASSRFQGEELDHRQRDLLQWGTAFARTLKADLDSDMSGLGTITTEDADLISQGVDLVRCADQISPTAPPPSIASAVTGSVT